MKRTFKSTTRNILVLVLALSLHQLLWSQQIKNNKLICSLTSNYSLDSLILSLNNEITSFLILKNQESIINKVVIPTLDANYITLKTINDKILISYSYLHATSTTILLRYNKTDNKFVFDEIVVYGPCQPCEIPTISTYEISIKKDLNEIMQSYPENDIIEKMLNAGLDDKNNRRDLLKSNWISFSDFYEYFTNIKSIEFATDIKYIEKYLTVYPLSNETIEKYNNIAYYLEKGGCYIESVFILEKITTNFPTRTVAYINLGDAYWGLKESDKAKTAYQKYIELMKASGKEAKIPQRVYDRIKQAD